MISSPPIVWLLLDDRAGNRGQVMGVAQALGLRYLKQELEYTAASALPNMALGASFHGLTRNSRVNLCPPWPDLVIAAGRRTAPPARYIKEQNRGQTFLCQIMYPGDAGIDEFDLVAVPHRDGIPERPNIMTMIGAPHPVSAERLAQAAEEWRGRLAHLPSPRIAVIVGGNTKRKRFGPEHGAELGKMAAALAAGAGGSLMITTSRRTEPEAADALLQATQDVPRSVFRWGDAGDNPYLGFLGLADGVIVTGDSVSMCSEAAAVPRPVYIYAPKRITTRKHAILHEDLYRGGYARPLEAASGLGDWTHPPLNPAAEVAEEIRRRLGV